MEKKAKTQEEKEKLKDMYLSKARVLNRAFYAIPLVRNAFLYSNISSFGKNVDLTGFFKLSQKIITEDSFNKLDFILTGQQNDKDEIKDFENELGQYKDVVVNIYDVFDKLVNDTCKLILGDRAKVSLMENKLQGTEQWSESLKDIEEDIKYLFFCWNKGKDDPGKANNLSIPINIFGHFLKNNKIISTEAEITKEKKRYFYLKGIILSVPSKASAAKQGKTKEDKYYLLHNFKKSKEIFARLDHASNNELDKIAFAYDADNLFYEPQYLQLSKIFEKICPEKENINIEALIYEKKSQEELKKFLKPLIRGLEEEIPQAGESANANDSKNKARFRGISQDPKKIQIDPRFKGNQVEGHNQFREHEDLQKSQRAYGQSRREDNKQGSLFGERKK